MKPHHRFDAMRGGGSTERRHTELGTDFQGEKSGDEQIGCGGVGGPDRKSAIMSRGEPRSSSSERRGRDRPEHWILASVQDRAAVWVNAAVCVCPDVCVVEFMPPLPAALMR